MNQESRVLVFGIALMALGAWLSATDEFGLVGVGALGFGLLLSALGAFWTDRRRP